MYVCNSIDLTLELNPGTQETGARVSLHSVLSCVEFVLQQEDPNRHWIDVQNIHHGEVSKTTWTVHNWEFLGLGY